MFKYRKQKENHEEMVREILEEMVEEGFAYKEGNEYGLTDLGICEAEKMARQGPIERMVWYAETTRMDLDKDKKKRGKKEKDTQNKDDV